MIAYKKEGYLPNTAGIYYLSYDYLDKSNNYFCSPFHATKVA